MRNINYDIKQFYWNGDTTTFNAEAWNLAGCLDDGKSHPHSFPTQKKEFRIYNYQTNGFRKFTFVKEELYQFDDEGEIIWIFKSDDGISCSILKFRTLEL